MTEISLTSKTRLIVECFKGKSRHGSFPGIRIRIGGSRKLRTVAAFHAGKALQLADALLEVFGTLEQGDDFFQSPAWLRLRYETLKKYGGRCHACGRSAAAGIILQVDHVKPRSKFPELALDPENLCVLCQPCNLAKGNRDSIDWREPATDAS